MGLGLKACGPWRRGASGPSRMTIPCCLPRYQALKPLLPLGAGEGHLAPQPNCPPRAAPMLHGGRCTHHGTIMHRLRRYHACTTALPCTHYNAIINTLTHTPWRYHPPITAQACVHNITIMHTHGRCHAHTTAHHSHALSYTTQSTFTETACPARIQTTGQLPWPHPL